MERRRTNRRIARAAAAAMGGLLMAACGLGGSPAHDDAPMEPPAVRIDCASEGKLPGSGATAQQNAMKYWIGQYQRACKGVQIRYNPLGSGAGVAQFLRGPPISAVRTAR